MLTERTFGPYRTEIDLDAAREFYRHYSGWKCACGHCRNFLALAHDRRLPEDILAVLDVLGIPPERASYVLMLCPRDGGLFRYEFGVRLPGRVLSGPERGDGGILCCHEPDPSADCGLPEPCFDLMFFRDLPWALEEPVEGH